jgi:phosphopentomutase
MGVTQDLTAKNNQQSIDQTIYALTQKTRGLIFSNLVDFDMLYGHRRDTEGYARALEHFDSALPAIEYSMRADDLMIITADHGNDPTFPGSDHTREYAPLLVFGKNAKRGVDLGTRSSLADIGQTIAENFGLKLTAGDSFLTQILSVRLGLEPVGTQSAD